MAVPGNGFTIRIAAGWERVRAIFGSVRRNSPHVPAEACGKDAEN
jgi:hypothetical protein